MKKDKMAERLTELQVCDLVKIYKQHECLWDVSNEFYKNREARDKAYAEITKKLNIPGLQVKDIPQKIKNLRTSYYAELRKIAASKKGGKVYKPKVAWFSIAGDILRSARSQRVSAESESESEPLATIKQDKINTAQNTKTTSEKKANEVPQTKYDDDDDEFDSYGKYMAFSLRSMPRELSILARLELQKTMADFQLRALKKRKRTRPLKCGPSTSKMNEDPLQDPLDHFTVDIDVKSNVKTEKEVIL